MTPPTSPTTIQTWLLVSDAASLLGCSVRTIERRIAEGTYTVQYDPKGRRLVDMTGEAEARQTDSQALHAAGMEARKEATQLAHTVEAMMEWHRGEAERLIQEATRARKVATIMGGVAAAAVALGLGGVAYVVGSQSDTQRGGVAVPRQSDTVAYMANPSPPTGGAVHGWQSPHAAQSHPDKSDTPGRERVGYATHYDTAYDIPPLLLP